MESDCGSCWTGSRSRQTRTRLGVHEGTLQALPLPGASLDAVISTHTVNFVPDLVPLHGFILRPVDRIVETMTTTGALEVSARERLDDHVGFTVLVLARH